MFRTAMAVCLVASIALSACGGAPEQNPSELNQRLFGRWQGSLTYNISGLNVDVPTDVGVSIAKRSIFLVGFCPVFGDGSLDGEGSGNTADVYGGFQCRSAAIGTCQSAIVGWTYAALLLVDDSTLYVTASGLYTGCDRKEDSFLAVGYLHRQ
jgi:hypothetical protein